MSIKKASISDKSKNYKEKFSKRNPKTCQQKSKRC